MPNALISNDPLVASNFFLEIDGAVVSILSGVSGLDIEMSVVETTQAGKDGKQQLVKTRGNVTKTGDLTITRLAASDAVNDQMWKWFDEIRKTGFSLASRGTERKNGSIVMYDSTHKEIARFNFYNAWPSKISTDALTVDSNDPVKETITLAIERLERTK
jgi:phage tail-like protein